MKADSDGAGQNRRIAESRGLDSRRHRQPGGELRPDPVVEEVAAVRADPAAEDDEPDIGHRGDRRDVQRDPACLLVDDP